MKQSSDEPDKIINVDVWLHAYQPKKKAGYEDIEEPDSRYNQIEMDLQRMKIEFAAILSRLGQGDNGRENNNVAIPTNQLINSTGDMSISKKRKEVENISISSSHVTRSKGEKKRKQGERNGDMSISKKGKEVESNSISSKHVRSSKGKKKKKKVGKNDKEAKLAPQMQQLHLLSWYADEEKIVATAHLVSKDPTEKVHRVPLGRGCWKVWVREVFEDIALMRPTSELSTLSAVKGSTVAWPITSIKVL